VSLEPLILALLHDNREPEPVVPELLDVVQLYFEALHLGHVRPDEAFVGHKQEKLL